MGIVYCEGRFLPDTQPCIPLSDRGFLCGDGVYATIKVEEGLPLFLSTHLERLKKQAATLGIKPPSIQEDTVYELIERNQATQDIWRLKILLTGGDSPLNHLPQREGRCLMFLTSFTPPPLQPLKMTLFPYPFSLCHASFKSLAHLNRYYVMQEAVREQMDDAITLSEQGTILEASFGNLLWIENETLYTPAHTLSLHFGVTVTSLLEMASELGWRTEEVALSLEELPQDAAYFRCSSMLGIRPIISIGPRTFNRNLPLEKHLLQAYTDFVVTKNNRKEISLPVVSF